MSAGIHAAVTASDDGDQDVHEGCERRGLASAVCPVALPGLIRAVL